MLCEILDLVDFSGLHGCMAEQIVLFPFFFLLSAEDLETAVNLIEVLAVFPGCSPACTAVLSALPRACWAPGQDPP